ncbi:class I SAM-dependent methyltransferase [Myxococcota bacterium]|nr:class I SAM-dependent methyltransferase [Myxococcota bacterium]
MTTELTDAQLREITHTTLDDYDNRADGFWSGTRNHDVSQNIDALLSELRAPAPARILDLGCGPGRDLMEFIRRGHDPIGLDGSETFAQMARTHAACEVWLQDFLRLELPSRHFDGVFANASLFHVPRQEVLRVLRELLECLRPGGVLFSSNPRGQGEEGWQGSRYGSYHDFEAWKGFALAAGFEEIRHYYRPPGKPRDQQPWLASLWRVPNEV